MDWTDFDADNQATITLSLITTRRAIVTHAVALAFRIVTRRRRSWLAARIVSGQHRIHGRI
jgi:hypothetical protein